MTPLEQLRQAREDFILCDRIVALNGSVSKERAGEIRMKAYDQWIAAVRRFNIEDGGKLFVGERRPE